MKKEVKFFLIILALFILIFISGCRTQEELTGLGDTSSSDTTPTPGTEDGIVIQNNKVSTSCNSDDDCQLINKNDLLNICCGAVSCGGIDYSLEEYVVVNKNSLQELKNKICNSNTCNGVPGCASYTINENFTVKCVTLRHVGPPYNVCSKVPK